MRQTRIEVPADEESLSAGHPGLERFKVINKMPVEQSVTRMKSLATTLALNALRCVEKLGGLFRCVEFKGQVIQFILIPQPFQRSKILVHAIPLITGCDANLLKSRPVDHGIGTKSQAAVKQYLASAADPARIAVGETSCYPATISCTCSTRTSEDS